MGAAPRSQTVVLEADLVGQIRPGDDVDIVGVLRRRWSRPPREGVRCDVQARERTPPEPKHVDAMTTHCCLL